MLREQSCDVIWTEFDSVLYKDMADKNCLLDLPTVCYILAPPCLLNSLGGDHGMDSPLFHREGCLALRGSYSWTFPCWKFVGRFLICGKCCGKGGWMTSTEDLGGKSYLDPFKSVFRPGYIKETVLLIPTDDLWQSWDGVHPSYCSLFSQWLSIVLTTVSFWTNCRS